MTNQKTKIVKYLLAGATVLLFINLLIDKFREPEKKVNTSELSRAQIEDVFFKVLDEYGINAMWVSTKKKKTVSDDSIKHILQVLLPTDVPIPLIIKDMNKIIEKDITGFVCNEQKIFGTTEIKIYTNEILKLDAVLIPDESLNRNKNELSFIIYDAFDLGSGKFNEFLSSHFPLSCAVIPNDANKIKSDSLGKYFKEYTVFINNDNSENKFKLEPGAQKTLLLNSVNNILGFFKNSKSYLIDESSKIYNSAAYNFVRDKFSDNNVELRRVKDLIDISGMEEGELFSRFKFFCNDTSGIKQKIFYCSFENFLKLEESINKYRKKGGKVIPISNTYIAVN